MRCWILALANLTQGKRTAKYKEIQQILAEDMPVVNLFELEFWLSITLNSKACMIPRWEPMVRSERDISTK